MISVTSIPAPWIVLIADSRPVSYTHLDVDKRQGWGASLSDNSWAAIARRQEEALGHFPLPAKQYSYPSGTSGNNIILLMING